MTLVMGAESALEPVTQELSGCFASLDGETVRMFAQCCVERAESSGSFRMTFGLTNAPDHNRMDDLRRVARPLPATDANDPDKRLHRKTQAAAADARQGLAADKQCALRLTCVSEEFSAFLLTPRVSEVLANQLRPEVTRIEFWRGADGSVTCIVQRQLTHLAVLLKFFPLKFAMAFRIAAELARHCETPDEAYAELFYKVKHGWPLACHYDYLDSSEFRQALHSAEQCRRAFAELALRPL